MRLSLKPVAELSDDERAALEALSASVYPPDVAAARPSRHLTWAVPDHGVLVWDDDTGSLVSYVGLLTRTGSLDGSVVRIGGIGSVKTHPRMEGRGYASAAIRLAMATLNDEHRVAFSLLVCRAHLLPFYRRFGWLDFAGRVFVEQAAGRVEFTINRTMVLPGLSSAPRDGTIDLNGPPW
jgi:predicted GNAT family N-acyltransferase